MTAAGCLLVLASGIFTCGCSGIIGGLAAGQESAGPWWMRETALTRDGKLNLTDRTWWPRATLLKTGEGFTVDTTGAAEGAPDTAPLRSMLVRREHLRRRTGECDAIVWIIDDDGDGSARGGPDGQGDTDSDGYVVDYGPDGVVDRMVDYIDNDGDNDADEMDIRYFVDGELRQVWVGVDLDDDNAMWDLAGYEYSADFFKSDPYGNGMIYMNKFNPTRGEWVPVSECPFAFYDTDGDGCSEVVVRISAVPLGTDSRVDPDYANDAGRYQGPWSDAMGRMGVANVRYSFDVDNLSSKATPLHYDFGFNLTGALPYRFSGMERSSAKRRPPQVTCVIPYDQLRAVADRYPAEETGFSWHEQHDDTIAIGAPPHAEDDFRWEGVFWTWERRFMNNTGGPGQKWNVRRERTDRPANRRELYYSEVDRRIHLFGAKEGWVQIGHFGGLDTIGEMRMFDTDGNGFFDRWEVYLGDSPVPVRVSTVRDERARRIPFDEAWLNRFYTQQVLPAAMTANQRLINTMGKVRPFVVPTGLSSAMLSGSAGYRRFAQDMARELQYQDLRRHFMAEANSVIRNAKMDDLRRLRQNRHTTARNSAWAWRLIEALETLDVAYGQGDDEAACAAVAVIGELDAVAK